MNLTDFSINKIIMVDDAFVNLNTEVGKMPGEAISQAGEFLDDLLAFIDEDSSKKLVDFFEEYDISEDDQVFFFNAISHNYQYFTSSTDLGIKVEKYLPEDFNDTVLNSLKGNKEPMLFVVDKRLSESEEEYVKVLRDTLKKIANIIQGHHNRFLFIYTSEVETSSDYNGLIDYLENKLKLDPETIKIIALHVNFVEKADELEESKVDTAIRKSQKASFLYNFYSLQKKTMESMNSRIWEINNNELLIHYNYLSEGQHIDEILNDIYKLKFSKVYHDFYKSEKSQLITALRESIHKFVNQYEDMNDYSLKSRIVKELNTEFEKVEMIQSVHSSNDISYGDVIKIGHKYYMVCSQQCDITIRSNGNRIDKDFLLLEIQKTTKKLDAKYITEKINNIVSYSKKEYNDVLSFIDDLLNLKEFRNLINNEEILNAINEYFKSEEFKEQKEYKFQNKSVRSKYESYIYKNKPVYNKIPVFILDALLINRGKPKKIIDLETIEEYSDIRCATKKALIKEFEEFKSQFDEWNRKTEIKSILGSIIFPDLEIEAIDNKDKALEGVYLKNVNRIGKLDTEDAQKIHQQYIENLTRISKNQAPII